MYSESLNTNHMPATWQGASLLPFIFKQQQLPVSLFTQQDPQVLFCREDGETALKHWEGFTKAR